MLHPSFISLACGAIVCTCTPTLSFSSPSPLLLFCLLSLDHLSVATSAISICPADGASKSFQMRLSGELTVEPTAISGAFDDIGWHTRHAQKLLESMPVSQGPWSMVVSTTLRVPSQSVVVNDGAAKKIRIFNGGNSAFTTPVGTLVSTRIAASWPTPKLMSCGKRGGVDKDGSIDVALRGAAARPLATARLVSVAYGFFSLADASEVNHSDTFVSPCTDLPACELRGWMPNRRFRHAVSDAVLAFEQQDEIINWISCTVMVGLLASALLLQRLVRTTACNHPSTVRRAPSHFLPPGVLPCRRYSALALSLSPACSQPLLSSSCTSLHFRISLPSCTSLLCAPPEVAETRARILANAFTAEESVPGCASALLLSISC